jgi:hypothetical protein
MTTTEHGTHTGTGHPSSSGVIRALEDSLPSEGLTHRRASTSVGNGKATVTLTAAVADTRVTGGRRPTEHGGRPQGVEVRVHGIGDHSTFSALGRPKYKELVDSRVWIGQVPKLPAHPLRLVNWSRANRKITRHLGWYLAFPFTLVNVAGYMEPHDRSRHVMRAGIGLASLCLTISMAAWLTVILETGWRALTVGDDRLTGVLLQGAGPGLLIVFIAYRMMAGRALVDKAGSVISVATIAVLAGMIVYLHKKPATQTRGWLHRLLTTSGDPDNAADAMSSIVVGTTAIVFLVALCLCVFALWKKHNRAAFAGAAVLLILAVTLLHAAGSMLRLFTASVVSLVPSHHVRLVHVSRGSAMDNVLLPKPDDLSEEVVARCANALKIDLIPVFFIAMLSLFAIVFWIELHKQHKRVNLAIQRDTADRPTKQASRIHELVVSLPDRLASPVAVAIVGTAVLWILMYLAFSQANPWQIADLLVTLQVVGAIAMVLIIIGRPEQFANRLRGIFGSVADIAGFWAPDLHPLAGASYRRALLSGIRQAVNDLVLEYPSSPIALVGHSQGSVVCAWFVRGGHWTEQPTEGQTDRGALKASMHLRANNARSDRIALFTCGSPLSTLYRTFFPRYFDDAFFDKTWTMTYKSSWWRNYWRATDPIGSVVSTRRDVDNIDVTESVDQETLGHGEYWRNARLHAGINRFFGTAEIKQPLSASAAMN